MKFKEKLLSFFGLGYEDEMIEVKIKLPEQLDTKKIYQEIAKDKPVIVHDSRTPLDDLLAEVNIDKAFYGLDSCKTPGERLRHIRKFRSLTQWELGELAGVSKSAIGDIELGRYATTSLEAACRISAELDVDVTDIWTTVVNK